jgi:hypothetical protein
MDPSFTLGRLSFRETITSDLQRVTRTFTYAAPAPVSAPVESWTTLCDQVCGAPHALQAPTPLCRVGSPGVQLRRRKMHIYCTVLCRERLRPLNSTLTRRSRAVCVHVTAIDGETVTELPCYAHVVRQAIQPGVQWHLKLSVTEHWNTTQAPGAGNDEGLRVGGTASILPLEQWVPAAVAVRLQLTAKAADSESCSNDNKQCAATQQDGLLAASSSAQSMVEVRAM